MTSSAPDPRNPPSLADMEAMADKAFSSIPEELARHVEGVVIQVADFPDDEIVRNMGLHSPFDLLGLYHGVSIDRRSVLDTPADIDMIFLYRRPILEYWIETGEALEDIVRNVLIHEIGHHFGLSDAEMEWLEQEGGEEP